MCRVEPGQREHNCTGDSGGEVLLHEPCKCTATHGSIGMGSRCRAQSHIRLGCSRQSVDTFVAFCHELQHPSTRGRQADGLTVRRIQFGIIHALGPRYGGGFRVRRAHASRCSSPPAAASGLFLPTIVAMTGLSWYLDGMGVASRWGKDVAAGWI